MDSLTARRFRSSPCVELRQLGELAAEERERFRELESDPEFYGLFVAKPPLVMNLKSVSRQTAELFRTLATPSRLDDALLGDDEYARDVVDLVLDGILEIESGGGFVSGADALPVVQPPVRVADIGRLSRNALLHAQDLETSDPQTLTMALYLYNRIPLSPFWKTRFASAEAVLAHVGADRGSLRALLEREWMPNWLAVDGWRLAGETPTPSSSRQPPTANRQPGSGWLNFSPRTRLQRGPDDVTYKLYVSPRPERIRDAFEVVVRVLSGFPGTPFKIGDGAAGLLRPDKMVAYFATREQLDAVAAELHRELAGCDPHGVPFTAALDETGLLSWGVDPPESERALRWTGPRSWRLWVAQRLGAALAIAKSARGEVFESSSLRVVEELHSTTRRLGDSTTRVAVEPWLFAIERTRRHGVDVETWTPSATLWSTP